MSRGHDRERDVRRELEAQGYWVGRICGSLGDIDLVALAVVLAGRRVYQSHPGERFPEPQLPLLPVYRRRLVIEVKSTAGGPYERFLPADRRDFLAAASRADCDAVLAYCPPGRRPWRWIWPEEWPSS